MTYDERVNDFKNLIKAYDKNDSNSNLTGLVLENESFMKFLYEEGFFTAPASTRYHGDYEGGLYDHSKAVTKRLVWLTENNNLKWTRPESPFIVGMFHDLCKYDQYIKTDGRRVKNSDTFIYGTKDLFHYEYNPNTVLTGHGSKSVILLSQFLTLTEEEVLCIRYHMGPYEKEEWAAYDAAIKRYETCLWTNHADMLASKIDGT